MSRQSNTTYRIYQIGFEMRYYSFKIQGFKYIETGPQDYGHGIIRIDSKSKHAVEQLADLRRNDLVRVQQRNGMWVTGILRYFDSTDESLLCLEYDDRLQLGVEKGDSVELMIRKASSLERAVFFWHHPNPIVRIEFKLAVFLASVSVALGFFAGLLVS